MNPTNSHRREAESVLSNQCCAKFCDRYGYKDMVEDVAAALADAEARGAEKVLDAIERVNRAENSTRQDLEDAARNAAKQGET